MCGLLKLLWSRSETSLWSPSPPSSCKESSLRTSNRVKLHYERDWASWMTSSEAFWPGTCPLDWDKNNTLIFFVLSHWDYEFLVQQRLCVCARTCSISTDVLHVHFFPSSPPFEIINKKILSILSLRQMTIRFSVWCQIVFICTSEVK